MHKARLLNTFWKEGRERGGNEGGKEEGKKGGREKGRKREREKEGREEGKAHTPGPPRMFVLKLLLIHQEVGKC